MIHLQRALIAIAVALVVLSATFGGGYVLGTRRARTVTAPEIGTPKRPEREGEAPAKPQTLDDCAELYADYIAFINAAPRNVQYTNQAVVFEIGNSKLTNTYRIPLRARESRVWHVTPLIGYNAFNGFAGGVSVEYNRMTLTLAGWRGGGAVFIGYRF